MQTQTVATPSGRGAINHPHPQALTLLRGHKVYGPDGRTGCSRSAWYEAMRTGTAPKPVRIGARAVAWRSQDIDAFIASRVEVS